MTAPTLRTTPTAVASSKSPASGIGDSTCRQLRRNGIAGPIDELDARHVGLQLDVNLRGTMLVTAAALPLLRETRGLDREHRVGSGNEPFPRSFPSTVPPRRA